LTETLDLIADFPEHEKRVSDYVKSFISEYRQSDCYKILDRRMGDLRMSADLKPASLRRNEYISHVVFPIVLEQSLVNSAVTASNYRSNELFNLTGTGSTPPDVIAWAAVSSRHRRKHLRHSAYPPEPCPLDVCLLVLSRAFE